MRHCDSGLAVFGENDDRINCARLGVRVLEKGRQLGQQGNCSANATNRQPRDRRGNFTYPVHNVHNRPRPQCWPVGEAPQLYRGSLRIWDRVDESCWRRETRLVVIQAIDIRQRLVRCLLMIVIHRPSSSQREGRCERTVQGPDMIYYCYSRKSLHPHILTL